MSATSTDEPWWLRADDGGPAAAAEPLRASSATEPLADVNYRPSADLSWLSPYGPHGVLTIDVPDDETTAALGDVADDLRSIHAGMRVRTLHHGSYGVRFRGHWYGLLVPRGLAAVGAAAGDSRDDGHLGDAHQLIRDDWDDAVPLPSPALFHPDDRVRVQGQVGIGRVVRSVRAPYGTTVEVDLDGRLVSVREDAVEALGGDPTSVDFWLEQDPAGADDIALTLAWTKIKHPLTDTIYSFATSRTLFRPYQFLPVLKLIGGAQGRLLVADEVGLGKTIEAGLIWTELEQRTRLRRCLVVCPSALTQKWKREMMRRFDRNLTIIKVEDLEDFARKLERDEDPPLHAIMSLESLRSAHTTLDRLDRLNVNLDLVIVDEAHTLRNTGTASFRLGLRLSSWADNLVFLSATPLNLRTGDLFNLVSLLNPDEFHDRGIFEDQLEPNTALNAVTRALASGQHEDPRRALALLDDLDEMLLGHTVTGKPDFAALVELLDRDEPLSAADVATAGRLVGRLSTLASTVTRTRKHEVPEAKATRVPRVVDVQWTEEETAVYEDVLEHVRSTVPPGQSVGFRLVMPLRQAASCLPAYLDVLAGRASEQVDDYDDEDEAAAALALSRRGALRRPSVDSKLTALRQALLGARAEGLRQAMVFSTFRGTLEYLARHLRQDFDVRVMHGGVGVEDREQIMTDFRAGDFEILLVSEVGSEGLDFEFCNVLVNYDLPWNPMRVEQRIGRLDRFGQQHEKIFIYNMHVPETIEASILQRLYDRIGIFESSIGELEPILRDELDPRQLCDFAIRRYRDDAERQREVERRHVAIERKQQQVEELDAHRAVLSSVDQLRIDGMTDEGPTNGRYVGRLEVRRLVDDVMRRTGGSLRDVRTRSVLTGNARLAELLRTSSLESRGSRYETWSLARRLEKELLPVTFDPDDATTADVDLLSARHPLVRLAVSQLESDPHALKRFGAVRVPGLSATVRAVARLDLVETSGLVPTLDLWVSAVDVRTGRPVEDVGGPLMTALAEGTLLDGAMAAPSELHLLLADVEMIVNRRRDQHERRRRQENVAVVDARIASRQAAEDRKIEDAQKALFTTRQRGEGERTLRMHRGRVDAAAERKRQIALELRPKKELSVSVRSVAVLLVEGAG